MLADPGFVLYCGWVGRMNWWHCPDVERIAGKVSGAWLVVGSRIPADAVVGNAKDGFTAEESIAEAYPRLPLDRERRIFAYAPMGASAPRPA